VIWQISRITNGNKPSAGHDSKALKPMFQESWSISDLPKAFRQALQARGYYLARGDARGHAAVDYRGEFCAIAKFVGVRTKQVRSRLGNANDLPSVEQAKTAISARMSNMLRQHVEELEKTVTQSQRLWSSAELRSFSDNAQSDPHSTNRMMSFNATGPRRNV
jgi:hypothetical protein